MPDEKALKDTAKRAEQAERLLNDPLIREFLGLMRTSIAKEMEDRAHEADRVQEMAYLLRATSSFEGLFSKFMKQGTIARSKLERFTKQAGI